MKRVALKQGTLQWEQAKETRIGSSEVFDIVRYYATEEELQNCGINAEEFRREKPYTTAWALYHKMLGDGLFKREELGPEFSEYGHAVEPYGVYVLQKGRNRKLKTGEVYMDRRLIASCDITGISEEIDTAIPFAIGNGYPGRGQKFVCEQKSMIPIVAKNGRIPYKYLVQAQYQVSKTGADFYIMQVIILKDDSPFLRGKICQMSRIKRIAYLSENTAVSHFYIRNNEHLAKLIDVCLTRFFEAVTNREEPTPFLEWDSQKNIIESIRLNTQFLDKTEPLDLGMLIKAKEQESIAGKIKQAEMQKIMEAAMKLHTVSFLSPDGYTGKFSKDGRFLTKEPAEGGNANG